jgi:glucose/arabinose dehydrogenase
MRKWVMLGLLSVVALWSIFWFEGRTLDTEMETTVLASARTDTSRVDTAQPKTVDRSTTSISRPSPLDRLTLPAGFDIAFFAKDVPNARQLALGDNGTVFVGTRSGHVWALVDENGDMIADTRYRIASGLNQPNGVAIRAGALYVAEVSRILRYDDIEKHLTDPPNPIVVFDNLPTEAAHGWKYIRFSPENRLIIPIGVPCNVCAPKDMRFGTLTSINPDGTDFQIIAHGVRNSVGYDFHPQNGDLWFTDNGRDWLGDDRPSDELNHLEKDGQHFGFPYCHCPEIKDPEFGKTANCSDYTACAQALGAHVAALGMRFYRGTMFPAEYRGDVLICEHGSWNRSTPDGYRLSRVRLDDEKPVALEKFIDGWLLDNKPWGRPVDLIELPDGSILVSDDFLGAVYRITYKQMGKNPGSQTP